MNLLIKIAAGTIILSPSVRCADQKLPILGAQIHDSFIGKFMEVSKIYPDISLLSFATTKSESFGFVSLGIDDKYAMIVNPATVIEFNVFENNVPSLVEPSIMTFKAYGFTQSATQKLENKNLVVSIDVGLSFQLQANQNSITLVTSADGLNGLNIEGFRRDDGSWFWNFKAVKVKE